MRERLNDASDVFLFFFIRCRLLRKVFLEQGVRLPLRTKIQWRYQIYNWKKAKMRKRE